MAITPLVVGIAAGAEVKASGNEVSFWDTSGDGFDGYEGPDYARDPWDLLVLNGMKVPGISKVDCEPKVKLKANKTVGNDGGPTIVEGHEAARISIEIKIWTPSQWAKLQVVLRAIWRRPGEPVPAGPQKAIVIVHPACAMWGVSSMVAESPRSPDPAPEHGAKIVKIKGVQFIAHKQKAVTKGTAGNGPPITKEFDNAKNAPNLPSKTESTARTPL